MKAGADMENTGMWGISCAMAWTSMIYFHIIGQDYASDHPRQWRLYINDTKAFLTVFTCFFMSENVVGLMLCGHVGLAVSECYGSKRCELILLISDLMPSPHHTSRTINLDNHCQYHSSHESKKACTNRSE